jgi:hypothetical protein
LKTKSPDVKVPTMTVIADKEKRVPLPAANPGDRFDLQVTGEGKYLLTRLDSRATDSPAKVKVEMRQGFSVGVLDRPIDEAALRDALSDFP